MCGITGFIHKTDRPVSLDILQKMTRTLRHRGPDDEGFHIHQTAALGFRRLSIIDLAGGHQPMTSPDGRYTIVFNGEIYNFREHREDLEADGVRFTTHSDTEVLLYLFIREGEKCLSRLNGMFAFAVWDRQKKRLFAARDRMGKKPFYYWDHAHIFAFASECKAILAHPDFKAQLNVEGLRAFFQYEYVPAPYSIYQGISKLPAGHSLVLDESGALQVTRYWNPTFTTQKETFREREAKDRIVELLEASVKRRLVADVPLGVFLSGGIDSSSVVALMARSMEGKNIKTFSIGFTEASYDESAYAQQVADHFHTDHHHQVLTANKMVEILPEVTAFLDEPFADYSIIPTYLLSQFTRQNVTVALGGDGGDELFAGYPTFYGDRFADVFRRSPKILQKLGSKMIHGMKPSEKNYSFEFRAKIFLKGALYPPVDRLQVWLGAYDEKDQANLFMISNHELGTTPLSLIAREMKHCNSSDAIERLLYFYQKFYLCDDILVKTDRASMATSLEVRAPYLDVDLVEYVNRLPVDLKLRHRETKYILKRALEGIVPNNILYRSKQGFGIPISVWLKRELKNNMQATLNRKKIQREDLFDPYYIETLMREHTEGKKDHRKLLFPLLMFEWWRERYLD